MTDKEKPRTFKDYLYKAVPKRVKKAYRVVKEVIKKGDPDIKMLRPDADKIGRREEAADKALAAHKRKQVVDIKTKKPLRNKNTKPKPKPKPKSKTKLKDKLITGAALGIGTGASVGIYKGGEKMGAYKERQEQTDRDLENLRKENERLKKKRLEKKKKKQGVWI